jgi:hypothetical protein
LDEAHTHAQRVSQRPAPLRAPLLDHAITNHHPRRPPSGTAPPTPATSQAAPSSLEKAPLNSLAKRQVAPPASTARKPPLPLPSPAPLSLTACCLRTVPAPPRASQHTPLCLTACCLRTASLPSPAPLSTPLCLTACCCLQCQLLTLSMTIGFVQRGSSISPSSVHSNAASLAPGSRRQTRNS